MAKLLPLHPGLGRPFVGPRAHTAPVTSTLSFRRGQKGGGSRPTWIHTDRLHPGQQLTLEQVEPLIHGRLATLKSALVAGDPGGTGLVSGEEFRRVLKSLLSVSQNQLDTVLNQVCERSGEAVDYMQFLRRFGRAPAARGACSSRSSERSGPQNTSMSLSEIQRLLKDKIGGNLRTVIRVFSLFDCNREGRIQRREFRRILDSYCTQLTDKEFQRLWNHYSPNNTSAISYQLFLDQLGFGDSRDFEMAPVCTKLEVSSRGTTPVEQRKQRPGSLSGLRDVPSAPPHRKLQTLFYHEMCVNSTPVWQALQAFDTTRSGLVKQDVLRAVLSSFIFPMNPHSFQKLTSCYGVRATGPVRWKLFLGHFVRPGEGDARPHTDRALEHAAPEEEDKLDLRDLSPRLKETSHLLDAKEAGWISRGDLRQSLERPGGTEPRTGRSRITEPLNALDPEHTGVMQPAGLERLHLSIGSALTDNAAPPPSPADPAEPLDVPEETENTAEEQRTPDERQTTRCADKLSLASASRRRMENLPLDKRSELVDPQRTGHVTGEEREKVSSCYDTHISDLHFNKLCETSSSRPGSSSKSDPNAGSLRNLGIPLTDETHTSSFQEKSFHAERPRTSPQSTPRSVGGQRPPAVLRVSSDTRNILDIVFHRMRSRLERHHSSLTDRIRAVSHGSDGTLSEADVRRILEDSWVILDDMHFHKFTEQLGLRDGRMERSAFLVKYEEAAARGRRQRTEGRGEKDEVDPPLASAEQCLAGMKTRIKVIHGDNLTAFRLMDRKRKGVVNCHDFEVLYSSLGFCCREEEYQRLLDLIGLHPGGNLNYAEFADVVKNDGKRKQGTQTACVQQQLHELLACEARYKWADMSKVLCQFDADGQCCIHKKSLRGLLFTYALPMRSDEFDQLWSRYDPDGRGHVAARDFLEKLGFPHEGELGARRQTPNRAVVQHNADGPVSSDAASLDCIEQLLQESFEELSGSLSHLETSRDGTVTVDELLSLLQTYGCSVHRQQLVNHLRRLQVSMDDNCTRLAYVEFLSAFDRKAEERRERPPASPDAVRQIQSLDSLSPGVALARLRELVTASAPNLYKAFVAFDQSGTGTVKALEFRQVLENFCARLSDNQYRYMLTRLQLDRENATVNWKDFLNKFRSQSPRTTERRPSKTGSTIPTKTSEDTEPLQQIQEMVSGHLYDITRDLMDLDPSNSTTVSKEQFRRLCDQYCLNLTNDQLACVWSQMPVSEQRTLQHGELLKRVGARGRRAAGDHTAGLPSPPSESRATASASATQLSRPDAAGAPPPPRAQSAPQCTSRRAASAGRPGTGSLQGSTERRLRAAVQRCWKEIQRNCAEEDSQQEGHISTTSFLEILRSLGIRMTREQLEHLAVKFDIINNGRVSYRNFPRHFLLNLKPAETERPYERRKLPLPVAPTGPGVLSEDCVEVLLRIREAVRSSWTSVRRRFLTCDPARGGSVPAQDFRKALLHFSVKLSEEEFFHLSSYLDADSTGRISYNNFLWAFLH